MSGSGGERKEKDEWILQLPEKRIDCHSWKEGLVGKVERTKIRIIILLFLLVYEGHLDVVVNINVN